MSSFPELIYPGLSISMKKMAEKAGLGDIRIGRDNGFSDDQLTVHVTKYGKLLSHFSYTKEDYNKGVDLMSLARTAINKARSNG